MVHALLLLLYRGLVRTRLGRPSYRLSEIRITVENIFPKC